MRYLFALLFFAPLLLFSQEDLPFQILVADGASIYGTDVKPMQYVDDVTSIDVKEGGFVSIVHKGGTTYELKEKVFTFYLKPEKLKNRDQRPHLEVLYSDTLMVDQSKQINILYPPFDKSGLLVWNEAEPFEFFWHLHDEPVLVYVLSISDGDGNKIQDFRTKHHKYVLKPSTFGLEKPSFMVQIASTFAGETISSKRYQVELVQAPVYEKKATDLVLKALDLEASPTLALDTWKEVMTMSNGDFYTELFGLFLKRNTEFLTAAGEDVEQLLSQNK